MKTVIKRIFWLLVPLCLTFANQAISQTDISSTNRSEIDVGEIPLPAENTVRNRAVELSLTRLQILKEFSDDKPLKDGNRFLVIDLKLLNAISPELVFDHNIDEKLIFHSFAIHGPFLQWNGERVIGRVNPKNINLDNPFPDPAKLSYEGDELTGQLVYEVPGELPENGASLLWLDARFDLLVLDLFDNTKVSTLDANLYESNGDLNLRVHDVDIRADGVEFSLSGYRTSTDPTVTSEYGSALPMLNVSLSKLFVDGAGKAPSHPGGTTPVVFVANRVLTHRLWYPFKGANDANDIGLVVFIKPPKSSANEPYWIIPLKGAPSIVEFQNSGRIDANAFEETNDTDAESSTANSSSKEESTGEVSSDSQTSAKNSENTDIEPPFAPPWPDPPEISPIQDSVIENTLAVMATLEAAEFKQILPGADHTDAIELPVDQIVGSNFSDGQKNHVYLLNPLEDTDQLTELALWSKEPKNITLRLYDLVDGAYGVKLVHQNGQAALSRLRIQKPTLLYISRSGGNHDYRLLWRTTQKLKPGQEYEPNNIRTTDPSLIANLPKMQMFSDTEYRLSGFIQAPDKTDYFVLESEEAGFVTLEATSGSIGIYVGSKYYASKVIDKRIFLADILLLPGKNVFYIHNAKGDYSVKATFSSLFNRWHELEPNNSPHLAHRLPIGQTRTGRLPIGKDYDYYFFDWPTSGAVRFSAKAGDGGDLSLWLYRDGVELKQLKAAESISDVVDLEAGTYDLLVYTRNPSLQPYTIRVDAENPVEVQSQGAPVSISIIADTTVVEPFSDTGQVINGIARVQNQSTNTINSTVHAYSSHDGILIDIPEVEFSVDANDTHDIPFQVRVRRSAYAVGKVPLFFNVGNERAIASATWHLSFPYDAPPTLQVWHDQPLPEEFMGAFDVARGNFGAFVHEDQTCRCPPDQPKRVKHVWGTDIYHQHSNLCRSAVHAGEITTEGGIIRTVTGPVLEKYTGSERYGIASRNAKPSANSFRFIEAEPNQASDLEVCKKALDINRNGSLNLINGLPFRSFFYGESMTVKLVGDQPIDLTGVILSLRGTAKNQAREFAIDTSNDGFVFNNVYQGQLLLTDALQPFVFNSPVAAKFARIRLLGGFSDIPTEKLRLGSFQVIAAKGHPELLSSGINLADRAMGAHVFNEAKGETVVSFHHNRLALINELSIESKEKKVTSSVSVQTSEYGPYGPWTVIANQQLKPKSTITLSLDEPVKAKYLKLSGNWTKAGRVILKTAQEAPSSDTYQSILAEWGNQESDAYFELGVAPSPNSQSSRISSSADDPFNVSDGDTIKSTVSLPLDLTDYFRVSVPDNTLSMELKFTGDTKRTQFEVNDVSGNQIDYSKRSTPNGRVTTLTISQLVNVDAFFVKVFDKPKHLAILWDDSRSVSPYVPGLHRMLRNFAFDVDTRFEKINLSSLYDYKPNFLMDTWAEDPYKLLGAIRSYVPTGSSSAYVNMEYALNQLSKEEGMKALLIMTDEQGDRRYYQGNKIEKLIDKSNVEVFSFHATSSHGLHDINANHMQTWADIGGGRYTLLRSKNDVPSAIAKVQAWLRKPAVYEMQVHAIANVPGTLSVISEANTESESSEIVAGAVEVILDASGSMWKKMSDGQPRIVVAKNVLLQLVEDKLPENLPFALRVFGNRKAKSCRTDLEIPLGPLSKEKASKVINSINPQNRSKTPIGASLKAVTKDLKKAQGKRIVILITDGEETCDADPKAVISELKNKGVDVQVNIVGFAIDDEALKTEFIEWASIGGGDYFDTNDAKELISSLQDSLVPQFQVENTDGELVAEGRLNGSTVELLPGEYSVRLAVDGYEAKSVTVPPGGKTSVRF